MSEEATVQGYYSHKVKIGKKTYRTRNTWTDRHVDGHAEGQAHSHKQTAKEDKHADRIHVSVQLNTPDQ